MMLCLLMSLGSGVSRTIREKATFVPLSQWHDAGLTNEA